MRPTLNDPKEWAIIRDMYFGGVRKASDLEPMERLERMESGTRTNHAR